MVREIGSLSMTAPCITTPPPPPSCPFNDDDDEEDDEEEEKGEKHARHRDAFEVKPS